jgi:organic hydroperoxide reductase OsmC/OhrA
MSSHQLTISWNRKGVPFTDNRYSRSHQWTFDSGITIPASASPHVVPAPLSDPSCVDPEEAFVASISACHMLWFLSIAAKRGFVVDSYSDEAKGAMGMNNAGKMAMTRVRLNPRVTYAGANKPTGDEEAGMHHTAHEECFIANSVNTEITVHPH